MATGLAVTAGRITQVGASALPEYVTLSQAIERSEDLLLQLQRQGLAFSPTRPTKFLLASNNPFARPGPPEAVEGFLGMEAAFLNSNWYVEELVVFELIKNETRVALRAKNMRRRFSEGGAIDERASREVKAMTESQLRTEKVYFLDLTVTRPFEPQHLR